ncbi:hypothetical protein RND71_035072 [Anisodus tanguticus]|uniref:Endonuclease-reverse transcriptase n=1 Tax=Anisodus tanguticus TaxID=243964 RepID=A0AAE1R4B6_9SOLA|nr:hypothetical protein RND71_035072 [Anisodus tanguticus]
MIKWGSLTTVGAFETWKTLITMGAWGISKDVRNDIVLIDESRNGFKARMDVWGQTPQSEGFRLGRTKTEYMKCKYSVTHERGWRGSEAGHTCHSKRGTSSIRSIIQENGKINDDVTHRIGIKWMKWRLASGVLWDKKVSPKHKDKFYNVVVRTIILFETECWPVKNSHVLKRKLQI